MKVLRNKRIFLLSVLPVLLLFAFASSAQDMQEIGSRMKERKPSIDALKAEGLVGEGVDGYLHFRQPKPDAAGLVKAENDDRRAANAIIAKREGGTVEQVAAKAAQKLIQLAPPGTWIRQGDGSWKQK